MWRPASLWTWAFIAVITVQAAIVLSFESYVFALFQTSLRDHVKTSEDYEQTIPTFLTLYIFGCVYELLLVWDALRLKNTIQIIGLCLYNLGLLIYAAVQKDQIGEAVNHLAMAPSKKSGVPAIDPSVWSATKPFLVAIPIIIAIGTVFMSFIARKLYDEFAWTIYKHISADLRMKRRYLTYQIYIALLKFDFFFFLGFTIQFIVIVASNDVTDREFALTIVAIPVTIGILFLAGYLTRKESKPGVFVIMALYFSGMAYFMFKLVRMYQNTRKAQLYLPARRSLTTFAVLTLILIIATIVNATLCALNFNKGLKPYLSSRRSRTGALPDDEKKFTPLPGVSGMEMPHLNYMTAPAPNRMTID